MKKEKIARAGSGSVGGSHESGGVNRSCGGRSNGSHESGFSGCCSSHEYSVVGDNIGFHESVGMYLSDKSADFKCLSLAHESGVAGSGRNDNDISLSANLALSEVSLSFRHFKVHKIGAVVYFHTAPGHFISLPKMYVAPKNGAAILSGMCGATKKECLDCERKCFRKKHHESSENSEYKRKNSFKSSLKRQ